MSVNYLSMEHHSICNLECTYCSETYFGGAKPSYNVEKTVEMMLDTGALRDCSIVVWGGGDPVFIQKFRGEPVTGRVATEPGKFNLPHDVHVTPDSRVYVMDRENRRNPRQRRQNEE